MMPTHVVPDMKHFGVLLVVVIASRHTIVVDVAPAITIVIEHQLMKVDAVTHVNVLKTLVDGHAALVITMSAFIQEWADATTNVRISGHIMMVQTMTITIVRVDMVQVVTDAVARNQILGVTLDNRKKL